MRPPIPGIAPSSFAETTSAVAWPSIGSLGLGRLVGRLSGASLGVGPFTLGKPLALASIPLALGAFAWQFLPVFSRRYRLTNRRIVILRGLTLREGPSIGLDEFDAIRVEILPGQDWLHCGEVVFQRDGSEIFRLSGVSRPAVFRETCLKARMALISVRDVLKTQTQDPANLEANL